MSGQEELTTIFSDIANIVRTQTNTSNLITPKNLPSVIEATISNGSTSNNQMISITYSELVSLRDSGALIPGMQYRITDYVTTTTQENTRSAGYPFDVIVTADDESTLNEVARACLTDIIIEKYNTAYSSEQDEILEYCGTYEYNGKVYHRYMSFYVHVLVDFSENVKNIILTEEYPYYIAPSYIAEHISHNPDNIDWNLFKNSTKTISFKYNPCINDFAKCNPSVWKLWYSLDNDTNRFAWADAENGKGVIYRMIDEWGNDCPYDFKNIQFKKKLTNGALDTENGIDTWCYTFNAYCDDDTNIYDASVIAQKESIDDDANRCYGNIIKEYYSEYSDDDGLKLNDIVFLNIYTTNGAQYFHCHTNSFGNNCHNNSFGNCCYMNSFGNYCYSNTFGDNCRSNSFGDNCRSNSFRSACYYNSFGDDCYMNSFGNYCYMNSFGSSCLGNSFGDDCDSNSFGNNCHNNSFGDDCEYNSFGNSCYSNFFGNECDYNSFGINCYYNSFGDECQDNSFGNYCESNSFGDSCYSNTFGNNCYANSFGNNCYGNSFGNTCRSNSFRASANKTASLKNHVRYNHVDDGCSYNIIWNSDTTSTSIQLKNINVNRGVVGTNKSYNFINITTLNWEKEININNYNEHIYIDYGDIFNVTYSELWVLRENSQFIPGRQYRIIDYVTTTSQENTRSAGHPFDIIVTALNEYTLSEEAQAVQHINDSYFDDSNLSAWKIWYCLDNDTDRFAWAGDEKVSEVEHKIYDSSECTINSDLIDGSVFITPFNFESCVWVDGDGVVYDDGGSNHDKAELVYEWGYFTDENDNTHLCLYKSNADLYEEEGQPDYGDKYLYRGVVNVDGEEYDYWQKWDESGESLDVGGSGDYVYATTARIVSNPEAYSVTIETEGIYVSGKGVIYRMIDEFGNDCPYDFKNIQFIRYELNAPETVDTEPWMAQLSTNIQAQFSDNKLPYIWGGFAHGKTKYWEIEYEEVYSIPTGNKKGFYTFSTVIDGVVTDHSLLQGYCYDNTIKEVITSKKQRLNNNVFLNTSKTNSCYSNFFGNECDYNTFGDDCYYNSFGNGCSSNSFGNGCLFNSFEGSCDYNSFGNFCQYNSFGNRCQYNSFGNFCQDNSFGNRCQYNSFGVNYSSNTFGNGCLFNSFGNECSSNSFGNNCYGNSFGISADSSSSLKDYVRYNHVDDGCSYNVIWNSDTTSSSIQLKNINVNRGVSGTSSSYNYINITTLNQDYEIQVAKNSMGEIKIYCEADLIA